MAADGGALSSGNTAWILTSTALVLFMTMPGPRSVLRRSGKRQERRFGADALFCDYLHRLGSLAAFRYGLAFGDGGGANAVIGGFGKVLFLGVGFDGMSGDIPESVFFMFQMTFAIITPVLIVGAYPERMKFTAVLMFSALWLISSTRPFCHWVWGGGMARRIGRNGFRGRSRGPYHVRGSALVVAVMLGSRRGDPQDDRPAHNPGMTMAGAAMLWVGWYGFNAGSALAADGSAGMALLVTHVAAATGALIWMFAQWIHHGKPSLVGIATGTIAGLATITPASGFVGPIGGLVIGFAAGLICYIMAHIVRKVLKLDDSLDVFAVHGVGGMLGIILTSFFAASVPRRRRLRAGELGSPPALGSGRRRRRDRGVGRRGNRHHPDHRQDDFGVAGERGRGDYGPRHRTSRRARLQPVAGSFARRVRSDPGRREELEWRGGLRAAPPSSRRRAQGQRCPGRGNADQAFAVFSCASAGPIEPGSRQIGALPSWRR